MRYTVRQKEIIELLYTFQMNGKATATLDHIVECLKLSPREWTRNGTASCMRDLIRKLPDSGCSLKSSTMLGRGHKTEYTFNGNLKAIVYEQETT